MLLVVGYRGLNPDIAGGGIDFGVDRRDFALYHLAGQCIGYNPHR